MNFVWITIALFLMLAGLIMLPGEWRGNRRYSLGLEPDAWWPWGKGAWSAIARAYPSGLIWFVALVGVSQLRILLDEPKALDVAFYVLLLTEALVVLGILLFNEPRWLVQPRFRSEPGLIRSRRDIKE